MMKGNLMTSGRHWERGRLWGVSLALASLLVTFAQALPAAAAPYKPGKVQEEPKVFGRTVRPVDLTPAQTGKRFEALAPVWPGQVTAEVAMPSAQMRSKGDGGPAQAAGLPVWVDSYGVSGLRVQSFDREQTVAAGVDGLLLRISRADAETTGVSATVSVDYKGFRHAYGGDWASRLRMYTLPECALTTPQLSQCQGAPVESSVNHAGGAKVTATVLVRGQSRIAAKTTGPHAGDDTAAAVVSSGTLVALASAPEGSAGDYKATSLSPSATWSAGNNTGEFSWSYALRMPPAINGPAPSITFGYSSAGVDGRMASANNQPSWIGEGFD